MPRVYQDGFTVQELQLMISQAFSSIENFECLILEKPFQLRSDNLVEEENELNRENVVESKNVYQTMISTLLNSNLPFNKLLILELSRREFAFIFINQFNAQSRCRISTMLYSDTHNLTSLIHNLRENLQSKMTGTVFEAQEIVEFKSNTVNMLQSLMYLSDDFKPLVLGIDNLELYLERSIAQKFKEFPTLKSATLIATKQSVPLWIAMTTFTCSSLFSLSFYGKHGNDTLLTSVIILTLQRVLWALTSTPLYSPLINISRAVTRDPESIGKIVHAAWLFAGLLGGTNALLSYYAVGPFLRGLGLSDDLADTSEALFRAYSLGFIGYAYMDCHIKTLIAFKKPLPILIASTFSSIVGVVAVYCITNGIGIKNHEKEGYAYGLSIQSWLLTLLLTIYIVASRFRKTYKLFSRHTGVLKELWLNIKEGLPIFFQRNADVFGTFSLAVLAAQIGPVALITEDIVESYRLAFGRVGINSVSQALSSLMGNQRGLIQLALDKKLNPTVEQRRSLVKNIKMLRHAGFILTSVHSAFWFMLYAAIPRQLSSLFVSEEDYQQYPGLDTTLRNTFLISGAGQFFDDFRQTYMAEFNAGKHLAVSTIIPNIGNFGVMTGLAYLLSFVLDMETEGLETANSIMFFIVTCLFMRIASYYLDKLLNNLMPLSDENDDSEFSNSEDDKQNTLSEPLIRTFSGRIFSDLKDDSAKKTLPLNFSGSMNDYAYQ